MEWDGDMNAWDRMGWNGITGEVRHSMHDIFRSESEHARRDAHLVEVVGCRLHSFIP